MAALNIDGHEFSTLQVPDDYAIVYDRMVSRNGKQVHLRRYQPKDHPEEELNHAHVTVVYGDGGYLYSYNAFTQPGTGRIPNKRQAFPIAEQVWADVDPDYRKELERLEGVGGLKRYYVDEQGKKVTIPIFWAKYVNDVLQGSYEWVGIGPDGAVFEFERESYWDFSANRQATEMWNGDDWILARRGQGPQLRAPLPLA